MIGFINIYKPSGMTSNAVIQKVKKKFNIKKIGHMGTLDPMACGLLPIAIGKATRLFDLSLNKVKTYNAIFEFGYETDTLDKTGMIVSDNHKIPSMEDVKKIITTFIGKSLQIPPRFSANHVGGKRAYELAREGVSFELKPKEIEIIKFELLEKIDNSSYKFSITCSSGTYIRSIGRDLGIALGTKATMTYLERCENGFFNLDNSVQLDKLLDGDINSYLISPLDVFHTFSVVEIDETTRKNLLDGKKINKKITNTSFIICNNELVGVANTNDCMKLDIYLGE